MRPIKKVLKPRLLSESNQQKEVKTVKDVDKKKRMDELYPDTHLKNEIEPLDLEITNSKKLVISVKRGGELGLPHCDIRLFLNTPVMQGFTKKGINFPLEFVPDLIELLHVAYQECEEKKIL